MRKIELYEIIIANAPPEKKYCIDELLKEKGHEALRIPPYHCDLNAIELAWAATKRYIKERNVNSELSMKEMKKLTSEALSGISKEQWSKYCDHVISVENKYWETDNLVEEAVENLSFIVGDENDSDSSTEIAESDSEDDGDNEM